VIAFQWTNKDRGSCQVIGLEYGHGLWVTSDIYFENPEPDSKYLKYLLGNVEDTHIHLLPRCIQERVILLHLVPENESIEGIGIKLKYGMCICEEE